MGVLFRDARAIETLREIDTLVIDKTGTLTEGKPALDRVIAIAPWSEAEVLSLAAGLERSSEHPLARAIVEGAAARGIPGAQVPEFESLTGRGVRGRESGRAIALGNVALMNDSGATVEALQTVGR